ncbi:hypothetical protein [Aridibaculum aurantiacum]|uniref:hypothetical protein n=1 Tax=Aridibaculum aurantiacum TaxID=2810307 RepID=UPI001A96785C|nr:hypothetical protein [Aridibaculum aurantiacum]
MQEYIIHVNQVEELQMIKDQDELERIFSRAKSTIVQGEAVVLVRKNPDGTSNKVDELTTETELEQLKEKVFKYM